LQIKEKKRKTDDHIGRQAGAFIISGNNTNLSVACPNCRNLQNIEKGIKMHK